LTREKRKQKRTEIQENHGGDPLRLLVFATQPGPVSSAWDFKEDSGTDAHPHSESFTTAAASKTNSNNTYVEKEY
jgi:hypothetical protein